MRQKLWAKLSGVRDCRDESGDFIVSFNECDVTDEEIGLILDTKATHAFNFIANNCGRLPRRAPSPESASTRRGLTCAIGKTATSLGESSGAIAQQATIDHLTTFTPPESARSFSIDSRE